MIRPNMTNSITKLLRLEEVLNRRKEINDNHLRIYRYDNAICYKYNTYSEKGDYKYKNKYLNKNNETYLMSYKFEIDDINKYKYLILMRRDNDKMNIIIKYDNKDISDKIILKMILGHFYK